MTPNKFLGRSLNMVLNCFGGKSTLYEPIPSNVISHPGVIGVARVVVQAANIKRKLLKPRPFVLIRVQGRTETRTTTQENKTRSPNWFTESTYVLIYSLEERLEFEVLNHHRILRPGLIGHATFPLSLLDDDPRRTGEEQPIIMNVDKMNGTLLFDIFYYPVSMSREIACSQDTGIVTLRIQMAKDFSWESYAQKPSKLFVLTSLGWSDASIHKTLPSDLCDFPLWNSIFDFVCFNMASTTVVLKVVDRDHGKNAVIYGHLSLALNELIAAQEEKREWWPLSGCADGQLRITSEWKPIEMDRNSIYMS